MAAEPHELDSGDERPELAAATPPTPAPATPTGGRGTGPWPMWVLGLVIMVDQIDQNILRGVIPQLQAPPSQGGFGLDDAAIGLLLSVFVLVNGLVTVPAGYLADRWHRTRTIGHTVVAWSGITMLTALASTYGQLLFGRAVLGFGQGITEPSANSLISDFYPDEQAGPRVLVPADHGADRVRCRDRDRWRDRLGVRLALGVRRGRAARPHRGGDRVPAARAAPRCRRPRASRHRGRRRRDLRAREGSALRARPLALPASTCGAACARTCG